MAPSKSAINTRKNLLVGTGLSGQAITGLDVWMHGIVTVIEVTTASQTQYIKVRQGEIEYGGTTDWGTGTRP